ncbi:MAG: sulfotransferase family 2 domain-containing protein [Devosia sp.]
MDNDAHQLAARHALSIYSSNAIYSFIPKNGCTTLRLSLALANGCVASTDEIDWIHRNNETFTATLGELQRAAYSFVVLRCPFRRLVSCYLDKIVGRHWHFWILQSAVGAAIEPESYTFRTFINLMRNERIRKLDPHWGPQRNLLVYETYDDVFDMANFDDVGETLKRKIGFDVVDARKLSRHGIDSLRKVDELGPDTLPLEILVRRSKGEVPRPRSLYDPELVEIVRECYADDIALFGEHFPASLMF